MNTGWKVMVGDEIIRKCLSVLIIILFIGISTFPSTAQDTEKSQSSRGTWLYVGGSGPGNYSRIQDAIDNASAGDIVFVYNGIYFENIRINKLINLIGCDRNTTILDGHQNSSTIITLAEGITIQNFTIQNSRDNGIEVKSNYTKISKNVIKNGKGTGVKISYTSYFAFNVISENIIINNSVGVYLCYSDKNTITNNVVSFNKYGGILMMADSNVILKNNIFNNTGWGIDIDGWNNTINVNTVKDNEGGIRIRNTYNTKIVENNFENNSIYLYLSGSNLITKNNLCRSHASFSITGNNHNIWIGNYWDKPRFLLKPIIGEIGQVLPGNYYIHRLPWVNFDWHPAQEPYDIEVC